MREGHADCPRTRAWNEGSEQAERTAEEGRIPRAKLLLVLMSPSLPCCLPLQRLVPEEPSGRECHRAKQLLPPPAVAPPPPPSWWSASEATTASTIPLLLASRRRPPAVTGAAPSGKLSTASQPQGGWSEG